MWKRVFFLLLEILFQDFLEYSKHQYCISINSLCKCLLLSGFTFSTVLNMTFLEALSYTTWFKSVYCLELPPYPFWPKFLYNVQSEKKNLEITNWKILNSLPPLSRQIPFLFATFLNTFTILENVRVFHKLKHWWP